MATPLVVPKESDDSTIYKISIDLIIQDTQAEPGSTYEFRDYIKVSQALLDALNNIGQSMMMDI